MTSPRFVNLNGPRPAASGAPSSGSGGRLNLHDPKVQVGGAAVAGVLLFALYKRKQAAAATGSTAATGVDPSAASTYGTTATGPYNSTASDVYNAIEPLFEQLAGVGPQQQALLSQILTNLQNGQTGTTSGDTGTFTPPAHAPAGNSWGGPSPTHFFPGGPRTAGGAVPTQVLHSAGSWG